MEENYIYTYAEYCDLTGWPLHKEVLPICYHRCPTMHPCQSITWEADAWRDPPEPLWGLDLSGGEYTRTPITHCPFCGLLLPDMEA